LTPRLHTPSQHCVCNSRLHVFSLHTPSSHRVFTPRSKTPSSHRVFTPRLFESCLSHRGFSPRLYTASSHYVLNTKSRIHETQPHEYMNNVFRLVSPVCDRNPYICKVNVFTKQAKYEWNTVFSSSLRVFNMLDLHTASSHRVFTLRLHTSRGHPLGRGRWHAPVFTPPSSVVKCLGGGVCVGVWGVALVVCVSVSGVLFSVGVCVCVCDLLIFLHFTRRLVLEVPPGPFRGGPLHTASSHRVFTPRLHTASSHAGLIRDGVRVRG